MNMEVKALQQMLSQFRQVQETLEKRIGQLSIEASAGGGMVAVKMNGQKQLTEVHIESDVFKSKDQEMLQELVLAAVNEATRRVDEELSKQVKDLTGGMSGMTGMKIPGLF
jgi:nucleoid-associated protein EbfC